MKAFHDSTWGLGDSTAHRCLELIQRHAPRLMVTGGGHVHQEMPNLGRPVPPEVRADMVRLRRKFWAVEEIAAQVGFSNSTVARVCRAAGCPRFRVVDGKVRFRRLRRAA